MPRHNMIIGGQTNAWGPNEAIPRWKQCLPSGRAEPAPPQRGSVHGRGRYGEGRKPPRRLVFLEGRTLCGRLPKANVWRGIS